MQKIGLSLVIAVTALGPLCPAPTQAQSPFVWVSDTGLDTNNCTNVATPCRSLSGGLAKVDSGGVIHVLPGVYNAVTINKSVQIIADERQASINPNSAVIGSAGLVIDAAPTDVVGIQGLTIDRRNNPSRGILLVSAAALHLENCTLVNSQSFGIEFRPTGNSELVVSNCTIANNGATSGGGIGIEVRPAAEASADVTLNNVRILNNRKGMSVFSRSNVVIRRGTMTGNNIGVRAKGGSAGVRIANSTINANGIGLQALNGGQIVSHRGNVVADNATNGAFTSTVNQQ